MTERCQVCFTNYDWRGFHDHHLIRRSRKRCDDRWNILRLCARDHEAFHGQCEPGWPAITLGMLLWTKRASGDEWRPHDLAELYRPNTGYLPPLETLPEEYLRERRRFTPYELPMPKTLHSDEAERLMLDPFWLPTWTLDKLIEPDGRVWWQVRDGVLVTAKEWGRGQSDVEAIQEAIEKNRNRKP